MFCRWSRCCCARWAGAPGTCLLPGRCATRRCCCSLSRRRRLLLLLLPRRHRLPAITHNTRSHTVQGFTVLAPSARPARASGTLCTVQSMQGPANAWVDPKQRPTNRSIAVQGLGRGTPNTLKQQLTPQHTRFLSTWSAVTICPHLNLLFLGLFPESRNKQPRSLASQDPTVALSRHLVFQNQSH